MACDKRAYVPDSRAASGTRAKSPPSEANSPAGNAGVPPATDRALHPAGPRNYSGRSQTL
ncbi:hypothetical protein GCM10009646_60020 [Streptomyces aureus]